jgi:hypothetical protein
MTGSTSHCYEVCSFEVCGLRQNFWTDIFTTPINSERSRIVRWDGQVARMGEGVERDTYTKFWSEDLKRKNYSEEIRKIYV